MYHEDQRLDIGKQVEGVHREEGWVIVAVRKSFAYRVNHLYNDIEHMYHDSLLVLKKDTYEERHWPFEDYKRQLKVHHEEQVPR